MKLKKIFTIFSILLLALSQQLFAANDIDLLETGKKSGMTIYWDSLSESGMIDERTLREIYLAGFETCVKKSSPATIMCSYNAINGELSSENKWLLNDVLREDWGYKGMVVSDWGAVYNRVKGIKAGLNLEMPYSGGLTDKDIVEAVKNGSLTMEELDKSVSCVLEWVLNYVENKQAGTYDMEKDHEESGRIAQESCVLLKNENKALPLSKRQKVLFVGRFAEEPRYGGGGSSKIKCYKLTDALTAAKNAGIKVEYAQGYGKDFVTADKKLAAAAVKAAAQADKVVVFAGLPESFESEGADRTTLDMPAAQNELIEKLAEVNKNVIVVLHNGSPVAMPWVDKVSGILECYLGGEDIGTAQINLLYGKANPCGKLAETFPIRLEDTPCFMNFPGNGRETYYTEGIFVGYRWYDCRKMPVLFPFGHGLSYTKFEYKDLKLSSSNIKDKAGLDVFVTIKNKGKMDGKEIVQLYVADKTGVEIRPVKELKGFEKVFLKAGEEKTVKISLDQRSFAYWNKDTGSWYAPSGEYEILVGASSADIRLSAKLNVTSSSGKAFNITPQTTMGDMLKVKEMEKLIAKDYKKACAMMDGMTDEEFEKKFPFPKVAMLGMILSAPFRTRRGRDGLNTFEDIQKYVDELNGKLK